MERLFDLTPDGGPADVPAHQPLAARMRPRTLEELVGQDAFAPGSSLGSILRQGRVPSIVLWGPPGSGKTSAAAVIAGQVDAGWAELSAVSAGVRDVRAVLDEARERRAATGRQTVLFIDEIHRFNRAQQDALLPGVEQGEVVLVGATTENPFFELNTPLLSRCTLVRLEPLEEAAVLAIVERALADPERGYGGRVTLEEGAAAALVHAADGDARAALNALETAVAAAGASDDGAATLSRTALEAAVRRYRYDRAGDQHYDIASAFIKSLRGSDPDAATYWLLRMLAGGEDPRFVARRMVIFASEDVGLADRAALPLAVAAFQALDRVGLPEAEYALVHAAVALATAPKSNAVARALQAGRAAVEECGSAPVPPHLRDAHSVGARRLGHGVGYQYPHEHEGAHVAQQYLPDALAGRRLYEPTRHGDEDGVADRLAAWRARSGDPTGGSTT